MKPQILLLAITAAAISSCTTAYKTGQTPDDVYFSPARPHDEYVRVEEDDNRQYRYDDQYYDDRYLRMKVADRTRWSELNDWYYYDRYSYTQNYYYGTYNNPYNSWNYYYNPYCHPYVVVLNPKQTSTINNTYVKPRNFSLGSYTNNNFNNTNTVSNIKIAPVPGTSRPVFNNSNVNTNTSNNSKGLGNTIRQIFTGKNNDTYYNNNNSSNSNSTNRTYNPSNSSNSNNSSSGSSNNSSSGSGGGGVTRPTRGGN